MKRYRCPDCRTVYTLRPHTHYRGFWAPWRVILVALLHKLKGGRWMSRVSRQHPDSLYQYRALIACSDLNTLYLSFAHAPPGTEFSMKSSARGDILDDVVFWIDGDLTKLHGHIVENGVAEFFVSDLATRMSRGMLIEVLFSVTGRITGDIPLPRIATFVIGGGLNNFEREWDECSE